ncbi:MAG: hypothetical protein AAGI30_09580 [Planctomycetota bacterium]
MPPEPSKKTPGEPALNAWHTRLHTLAAGTVADHPVPAATAHLVDEAGSRWPGTLPFFAWRRRQTAAEPPTPETLVTPGSPDQTIWSIVATDQRLDAPTLDLTTPATGPRPLFDQGTAKTIEVWTEQELSALHALRWLLARETADAARTALRARMHSAIRWHLAATQPDNATNRPWALHVFAEFAVTEHEIEADLYAQTLLHNCMQAKAQPDTLSAHILQDAADALANL